MWLSWWEHSSVHPKVVVCIPSQGTYPGWGAYEKATVSLSLFRSLFQSSEKNVLE